jgi:NAD-dependent deacetylase
MPKIPKEIAQARKLLHEAKALCVLTGAGISAESGLKTFRDAGGLWEEHPVEKVATPQGFAEDPELVWRFYNARRKSADIATPNAAHIALARLEIEKAHVQKGKKHTPEGGGNGNGNGNGHSHLSHAPFTLLTQNIDGLHQQAGSKNVIELHGSIWKVRCTKCQAISSEFPIELPILPQCELCDGLLRPDVVWFGEMLDPDVLDQAEAATQTCDVFLVIGTSAVVQPAATFPFLAAQRKVPVVEVNKEPTTVSSIATISLQGNAGEILPQLVSK